MFDKEIEAIAKCTELVKDLDEDSKYRVIKYLIERFGIAPQNRPQQSNTNNYSSASQNPVLITGATNSADTFDADNVLDFPSLKELLIKNYPKNESEWLLCYAFFASKQGTDTFSKDSIVEKYKDSNRFNDNNKKNLSNNINSCIKKDWFKPSGETFILKPEGITYAKEVLAGRSTSKEVKAVKRKPKQSQTEA